MEWKQLLTNGLLLAALAPGLRAQGVPAGDLKPVPVPDLSDLEDGVRQHIETNQQLIEKAVADTTLPRPALAQIFGEAGKIYHSYHLDAPAEVCYRNARLLNPTDYTWHHYLGVLYRRMGRAEAAEHSLEMALALAPYDHAARLWRAELLLDSNRIDEAETDLRIALVEMGESGAVHLGLGRVAQARQDFSAALEHFQRALVLVPRADSLHYLIGQTYRDLGDLEAARSHLAQSGQTGVSIPDPLMEIVSNQVQGEVVHLLRGRQAFSSGDFEAAREQFQAALDAAPTSSRARINLAAALVELKRVVEARTHLEEALRLDPGNRTARFNLGKLAFYVGDYELAVNHLKAFIEDGIEDVMAVSMLGLALFELGRKEEALNFLAAANRMAPENEQTRLRLASILIEGKEYQKAIEILRSANRAHPGQAGTASLLAQLLALAPQLELRDGQEAYRLALKLYQDDSQPSRAELLALALAEMGRCESAIRWLQTAITLAQQKAGNEALLERLTAALPYYQNSRPCRPR